MCNEGFHRADNGECVPCPTEPVCGRNEHWTESGNECLEFCPCREETIGTPECEAWFQTSIKAFDSIKSFDSNDLKLFDFLDSSFQTKQSPRAFYSTFCVEI